MLAELRAQVDTGQSTPGENQNNDVEVDIWKLDTMPTVSAGAIDDY